jgi:hypothetical protein
MDKNPVDWDKKLPEKHLDECHKCGDLIVSDDKTEIVLFMIDHYGPDNVRKCTAPEP